MFSSNLSDRDLLSAKLDIRVTNLLPIIDFSLSGVPLFNPTKGKAQVAMSGYVDATLDGRHFLDWEATVSCSKHVLTIKTGETLVNGQGALNYLTFKTDKDGETYTELTIRTNAFRLCSLTPDEERTDLIFSHKYTFLFRN
jgi:hypothetical protein